METAGQVTNPMAGPRPNPVSRVIADMERTIAQLGVEIEIEENRSGHRDPASFDYSTYAASCRARRDKLVSTIETLRRRLSAPAAEEIRAA